VSSGLQGLPFSPFGTLGSWKFLVVVGMKPTLLPPYGILLKRDVRNKRVPSLGVPKPRGEGGLEGIRKGWVVRDPGRWMGSRG